MLKKNKWHVIEQIDVDYIANRFDNYFSSIGSAMASGIKNSRTHINDYISKIPIAWLPSLFMHVHKMKYQNL